MIEEAYCSFETCKLLKEKGYDGVCKYWYIDNGKYITDNLLDIKDCAKNHIEFTLLHNTKIPFSTQQMAMRWLREVHHIHICPEYKAFFQEKPKKIYHHWCNKIIGIDRYFKQGIQDLDKLDSDYFYFRSCKTYHNTYEDACEECIEFALKNLI